MMYLFLSFIFCGLAIPCFEHGRTSMGVSLIVLSCFMPVLQDTVERLNPPPPPPVVIKPDPAVEARFKSIISKLDELDARFKRCSELLDVLSTPAQ